MFLKNSMIHDNTAHIQHQEFHEKVKSYKKRWSLKPNKYTLSSFTESRSFKK